MIEQRYFDLLSIPGNDDHPSHDIAEGQRFVKEVYETLRASPQWNEMLFLILYDEHGGFYDHVPTPTDGVPSPDDIVGPAPYNFHFNRLGVRVPAILISPWIERGTGTYKFSIDLSEFCYFQPIRSYNRSILFYKFVSWKEVHMFNCS